MTDSKLTNKFYTEYYIEWLRVFASENGNSEEKNTLERFIQQAGNAGLFGIWIPTMYGGAELPIKDALAVIEQLSSTSVALSAFLVLQHSCSRAIVQFATSLFKKNYLPKMSKGEITGCFALSEPHAGSNPRAITTKITSSDKTDNWLINGTKCWVGGAELADIFIVFATHAEGPYKGISCFAIPSTTKGIKIDPPIKSLGVNALGLCTITLQNVEVTRNNLLGELGKGMIVAEHVLMRGRLFSSAISLGIMKRSAQLMHRYASKREIGTGLLLENPVTISLLTWLNSAINAVKVVNEVLSGALDQGIKIPSAGLIACKIVSSELAGEATDKLVQLLGARGLDENNGISQLFRDTRFLRIGEGPTETLLMELGALLRSQDPLTVQFITIQLTAERAYSRLIDALNEIEKLSPHKNSIHIQLQYYNTGRLGVWTIIEACLEHEIAANNQQLNFIEILEWVKQQFYQTLAIIKINQTNLPDQNKIAKIKDTIELYDKSIGKLEDVFTVHHPTLDSTLSKFKLFDRKAETIKQRLTHINLYIDNPLVNNNFQKEKNALILQDISIKKLIELGSTAGHTLNTVLVAGIAIFLARLAEDNTIALLIRDDAGQSVSVANIEVNEEIGFKEFLKNLNIVYNTYDDGFSILNDEEKSFACSRDASICICFDDINQFKALKNVDLYLYVKKTNSEITFSWIYKECFNKDTILQRSKNLCMLLRDATLSNNPINQLKWVTEEEQKEIFNIHNDFERRLAISRGPYTISQVFDNTLKLMPNNIALVQNDKSLTYSQLDKLVNKLARLFKELNILPDDIIAFFMGRTIYFIASLLAVLRIGATVLPLNIRHPKDRNQHILNETKAKIILTEKSLYDLLPDNKNVCCVDNISLSNYEDSFIESVDTPESIAYIIYTSGSTGTPKGVIVSQLAICNFLICRRDTFNISPVDRILYLSVPNFDIAVWEFFGAFAAGASIALSGDNSFIWDPKETAQLIYTYKVTHIQISPTQLNLLLLSTPNIYKLCASLKCVFSGGEVLPKQTQELFFSTLSSQLIPVYGSTEAVLDVTYWRCKPGSTQPLTYIGIPVSTKRLYIVDKYLRPVPSGVAGELCIGGDSLAKGYFGEKKQTDQCFMVDPFNKDIHSKIYRSGDRVRILPNGGIEFLGRIDQQIKINGLRIEPREIERVLEKYSDIKQVCVTAKKNRKAGLSSILIAYYVTHSNKPLSEQILRELVKNQLPKEMVPSLFMQLETLPMTSTGKLDIKSLPELSNQYIKSSFKHSVDSVSKIILDIWEELLNTEVTDESSDFFELGGHSLIAVQVLTRVREIFSTDISMSDFFENPTLKGLVDKIKCSKNKRVGNYTLTKHSRDEVIPLAETQENFWYLYRLNPNSAVYNCPEAVRLNGCLNINNLEWALNTIINRHESLRTIFKTHDGIPKQFLLKKKKFQLTCVDFTKIPFDKFNQVLLHAIKLEASRPFKLDEEQLFRAMLFKTNENEHVLFWNFHHIIADGWSSARVFRTELSELYTAKCESRNPSLPDIEIQAIDYMFWQKKYLSQTKLEEQQEFWKKELDGSQSEIDITLGHRQITALNEEGCRVYLDIPNDLFVSLQSFSQKMNFTSFEIFMSGFFILAHIFSGENDINIGTVVAGRKHSSIDNVIGNFANVVVVRSNMNEYTTFLTLLEFLRDKMIKIIDNSDISFEEVVSTLHPNRKIHKNPLFNLFISLYNGSVNDIELAGLKSEIIKFDPGMTHFDFAIALFEAKTSFEGYIEYRKGYISHAAVERIARYYIKIIQAIINTPNFHLDDLQIIDQDEQNLLLNSWNDSKAFFPASCLHQLFEEQVRKAPYKTAITFSEKSLSYAELNQRANKVARYLRYLGCETGDLIGLCVKPSVEMIVGLLGIVKAGAAYVPLDPSLPKNRIDFIVNEINAKIILTQNQLLNCVAHCAVKIICLDTDWPKIQLEKSSNLDLAISPDNLVYMIFTSGSTGNPKGVETLHYNVAALICNTNHMQPLDTDVFAKVNNFAFDVSTWEIWTPLVIGASLLEIPEALKFDPPAFAKYINNNKITMLYLPTALFHSISAVVPSAFGNLKLLVVGGEPLDPTRAREVLANNPPKGFINAYGPTEVTCNSAWYDVTKLPLDAIRVPIGRPISNTKFYVLNNKQKMLPVGAKSELYIGGAGVSRGYRNRNDLTKKHFISNNFEVNPRFPRLYRTGDIVRYLPDGNLEFLGRVDHQIKIRGFRVEIGEIESVLRAHIDIQEAIVMIREDEQNNKRLIAFIAFNQNDPTASVDKIKKYLTGILPSYMVPSAIINLESLPLNTNGKVDRNKLKSIEVSIENTTKENTYPRNEVEARLLNIWENIIDIKDINIHTNFFEAGGDSLRAVQLLATINKEFSRQLPLEILYEEGSIESLAVELRSQKTRSIGSGLICLYRDNNVDKIPLFLVHPLSGSAVCYSPLARVLKYPLFGLQSISLETDIKPFEKVDDIAANYLATVLKKQNGASFYLGGWSFGGIVAFEMVRQLEALGQSINVLLLFDSVSPGKIYKALDTKTILKLCLEEIAEQFNIKIDLNFNHIDYGNTEILFEKVLEQIKIFKACSPDFEVAALKRMVKVCLANAKATEDYRIPNKINSDIILFRASDTSRMEDMLVDPLAMQKPCLGWSDLTTGKVSVVEVQGNHMSMLFQKNIKPLVSTILNAISISSTTNADLDAVIEG